MTVLLATRIGSLVRAIQENDDARIEEAVLRLSRSRRVFAPLAFAVGAFVLLFDALRLIVSNWRLMLVQILPAMWIWLAMFDLKLHVLHGRSFHVLRGPILIPIGLVIVALTVVSFLLNAVFAFAVARSGRAEVRPAFHEARRHVASIAVPGVVVGIALAFATTVVTRWGHPWFAIALGIVVGLMMLCYVAVPSRLIGIKPAQSKRDKLTTTAVGGALGRHRVHTALRDGAAGDPDARVQGALHPRHLRAGGGRRAPGRRHRGGAGDQDERQAGRGTAGAPGRAVMAGAGAVDSPTQSEAPRKRSAVLLARAVRIGVWFAAVALALWLLDLLGVPVADWIRKLFQNVRSVPPEAIVAGVVLDTSRPCSPRCRGSRSCARRSPMRRSRSGPCSPPTPWRWR